VLSAYKTVKKGFTCKYVNCKNKEGFPDLRIVRKYIIIDDVILGIAIIATVVGIILLAIK
jgi:hypothetical protein